MNQDSIIFTPNPSVQVRTWSASQAKATKPEVSLLVSFYNNLPYLKLVLASIEVQSHTSFEVIICDDGSRPEVVNELHRHLGTLNFDVTHIWQSDRGFTKNECLNRGITSAKADYLIFIDGDCVLHPQFIQDHFESRQAGFSLSGRRSDLNPRVTQLLTESKVKAGFLQKNWWWIILEIVFRKDNNGIKGIRINSDLLFSWLNRRHRGLVGCNFSVFKSDLLKINGFDMQYTAPGVGEDSDIDHRLQMAGVDPKSFAHRAVQYHLYHRLLSRSSGHNEKILEQTIKQNKMVCELGLSQLGSSVHAL